MDEKIKKIFTEKLSYYLSYRDKTQADLARAMGVTTSTVSDWCNGKKMPRSDRLQAIARWLGIELSDLLTEGEAVRDQRPPVLRLRRPDPHDQADGRRYRLGASSQDHREDRPEPPTARYAAFCGGVDKLIDPISKLP